MRVPERVHQCARQMIYIYSIVWVCAELDFWRWSFLRAVSFLSFSLPPSFPCPFVHIFAHRILIAMEFIDTIERKKKFSRTDMQMDYVLIHFELWKTKPKRKKQFNKISYLWRTERERERDRHIILQHRKWNVPKTWRRDDDGGNQIIYSSQIFFFSALKLSICIHSVIQWILCDFFWLASSSSSYPAC